MSNSGVFLLPDDILREIFIRLPVKSIGKSRCLCKQGNSFLTSPRFIKTYDAFHANNPPFSQKLMLFRKFSSLITCSLRPDGVFHGNFRKLDSIPPLPASQSRLVGPCNGLILIVVDKSHNFLMNPTTLEHSRLPESRGNPVGYGLGYDSSSDDYKVVTVFSRGPAYDYFEVFADIYSVKMKSWSRTDGYGSFYRGFRQAAVFVNGALHWMAAVRKNVPEQVVCALDLGTEKFYELPLPESLREKARGNNLIVTKGCLGIVIEDFNQDRFDIWIMNKYGMAESWTKTILYNHVGLCWGNAITCRYSNIDKSTTWCYSFDDEKSFTITADVIKHILPCRGFRASDLLILSDCLISPHHYNTQ